MTGHCAPRASHVNKVHDNIFSCGQLVQRYEHLLPVTVPAEPVINTAGRGNKVHESIFSCGQLVQRYLHP